MRPDTPRVSRRIGSIIFSFAGNNSKAYCQNCGYRTSHVYPLVICPVCPNCKTKPFAWSPAEIGPDLAPPDNPKLNRHQLEAYRAVQYMLYWQRCWELHHTKPPSFWLRFLQDRGIDTSDPDLLADGAKCELPSRIYKLLVNACLIPPSKFDIDFFPPPIPSPDELDRAAIAARGHHLDNPIFAPVYTEY